jgi:hypothetical protein
MWRACFAQANALFLDASGTLHCKHIVLLQLLSTAIFCKQIPAVECTEMAGFAERCLCNTVVLVHARKAVKL